MNVESTPLSFSPYMADVGIVSLVPDMWEGPWQPRHQVLTRLAEYFHVVWVSPAREWRDVWIHPTTHCDHSIYPNATGVPGFVVYNHSMWFPKFYRPRFLDHFTERQRLRQACQTLFKRGCRKIILYLWRPQYEPTLDMIAHDLSCYHIDDEYTFSDEEKPISENEAKLISRVDQVFIHSPALLEKKGKLNPQTLFVPNGVDYNAYATPRDEPVDIEEIPHPRIGYTGRLKAQLDWQLLLDLTVRYPEWSFVFVGPQAPHPQITNAIQELRSRHNAYFLGTKSPQDLAAYPQHFDVCIMPYCMNDYTKYIYPLKLHEYLASGRPVVGSPIRSLQEFRHLISLARTTEEWSLALSESFASPVSSIAQVEARRVVARKYDWHKIVGHVANILCSRLGGAYLERFEKLPSTHRTEFPEYELPRAPA